MDLRTVGGHRFTTHCLIRLIGHRTGRVRITPLIYGSLDGEVVVVGSNSGRDHHPAWYRNLRARPTLDVQIATQAFHGTWREPGEAARTRLWDLMVAVFPPYADYRRSTQRRIPIVVLTPTTPTGVFSMTGHIEGQPQ